MLLSLRLIPVLQLAVPMLLGASLIFFFPGGQDINDPQIPLGWALAKDAAFAITVLPLAILGLYLGRRTPLPLVTLLVVPPVLALLMLLIGILKSDILFVPSGAFRNLAFYYLGGGLLALVAYWYGYERRLFQVFRAFMVLSVLTGLGFYALADNLLLVTIHGRMVGTLGNPNFLGYLCFLWIVILHGFVAAEDRLRFLMLVEFGLALIGLLLSSSIAALVSYLAWLALLLMLVATCAIPPRPALRRLVLVEILALLAVSAFLVGFRMRSPRSFQIIDKVVAVLAGRSGTYPIRLTDLAKTFAGIDRPTTLLLGQMSSPRYVQMDGAAPTILYNLGLPFFLLWNAFFLFPAVAALRAWPVLRTGASWSDFLVLLLAPCFVVSVTIEFWIQYIPEAYPPCVILAWLMYFAVLHAWVRKDSTARLVQP